MERIEGQSDFESFAKEYSEYSRRQLFIELDRHLSPIRYAEEPTDDEKEASGVALWLQIKRRLAVLVCSKEKIGSREKIKRLLDSGIIAFITQVGPIILGSGIVPGITIAGAAALAAILAEDLLIIGRDNFCKAYHEI